MPKIKGFHKFKEKGEMLQFCKDNDIEIKLPFEAEGFKTSNANLVGAKMRFKSGKSYEAFQRAREAGEGKQPINPLS